MNDHSAFRNYIHQTLLSPRWQPLRRLIAPYVLDGTAETQWLRTVMNRETSRLVEALDPGTLNVLEISGDSWNRPGYFRSYRPVQYPELDICNGRLDEKFDLIIAEQVFEHLPYPHRAARNVRSMLNPGGHFLITTPFLVRVHPDPDDYTRWTESGLRCLLEDSGFPLDGIRTGSWGNRQCVIANFRRWPPYQSWRHSLKNDPLLPISVWALARQDD